MRLAKFIADSGIASRREAERLIESGKVSVNGAPVLTPVFFVDGSEKIYVNGKIIPRPSSLKSDLYAFHKPASTMCSRSDPAGRKTIYDVLPPEYRNLRYIGRLDYKTTGLLLLTNDGELARQMTLPSSGLKRVYLATLHAPPVAITARDGSSVPSSPRRRGFVAPRAVKNNRLMRRFLSPTMPSEEIFDGARRGITIDGIHYAPMEIEVVSRYPLQIRLTLREGKKNEIRIVMKQLGFLVKKLHRISYGDYHLADLPAGGIRKIK